MSHSHDLGQNSFFVVPMQHHEYEGDLLADQDDNSISGQSFSTEGESNLKTFITVRQKLLNILYSTQYQVFIVFLVGLDTLIVITELLLDLELENDSQVPYVLHIISISFLSLFLMEICVKIYAFRVEYFSLKGELFDAVVIIGAFTLDLLSLHSHNAMAGVGLIIVLRLWRIVRIQNSIVMSVHRASERKVIYERELRKTLEAELEATQEKNKRLIHCCSDLLNLLQEKGIDPTPALRCPIPELDATT